MPYYPTDDLDTWLSVSIEERVEILDKDEKIKFINDILNPVGYCAGLRDYCQDALDMMIDCEIFKKAVMNTIDYEEIYETIKDNLQTELDALMAEEA